MTTPEAVNRLTREIKRAIPHWQDSHHYKEFNGEKIDVTYILLTCEDAEVEEALKNLIQAIQDEQS